MHKLRRRHVLDNRRRNIKRDLHFVWSRNILRCNRRQLVGDMHELRGWHRIRSNRGHIERDLFNVRRGNVVSSWRFELHAMCCRNCVARHRTNKHRNMHNLRSRHVERCRRFRMH